MDPNQRDDIPAAPGAPDGGVAPAGPAHHDGGAAVQDVKFPPWPEAPVASNLRKAQVRAALFRKPDPIRVGRFILLEPLGAGAMGEIYAAYDDQLDRKVALKLVRSGSGISAKADERLLREAQTLAQVSHPNVVQIYEAGTYNGRLFIAMELVRGKTLTTWLRDAARLPRSVRQREILRQFIAAGHGLEAAHAAGVAHRDFKPDNVLVGDDGRVRVVDFGLARALVDGGDDAADARAGEPAAQDVGHGPTLVLDSAEAADVAESPVFSTGGATITDEPEIPARAAASSAPRLKAALRLTETGAVMGTPSFMAPEQMRGAIADLRSDQFSFCVALYHALYDAFPFSGRTLRELRDSIGNDEVEFLPSVPVPVHVRRALLRGLSVEPAQRFASMADLIAALSPRTRRLRVWIAAGAIAIGAGAVAMLQSQAEDPCAAAGAGIDVAWSIDRQVVMHAGFLHSELPFADPAWRGVKARVDGYASKWRGEATAACQATHVEHTQSAQQLDRRMLCLDRGRRQLAALVSELSTGAADAVEHAVEAAGALPELDTCSHADSLVFGVAPPPAAIAAEVAAVRDRIAQAHALELLGRYDESLAIARDANTAAGRMSYPPLHAEALVQVARAVGERSTSETRAEAQRLYFQALPIAEAERHDQLVMEIWRKLVLLAVQMDSSMVQAHEWWGQAYAWSRRNAVTFQPRGPAGDSEPQLHFMLGEIYYREGEYARSADEERRALAALSRTPAHELELSRYEAALALSLERLDGLDEALRLHEHALKVAGETLGAGHPEVITLEISYSKALEKSGQLGRARSVLEAALASIPTRYRDSHPDAALIHAILSDLDYTEGHLDHAAEHGHASLQIYKRTLSPDHVTLAMAYTNLANVEIKRRNFDRSLVLYQDALSLRRRHLGNDHYLVGVSEGSIAESLVGLERPDEAMPHLAEAERIFNLDSSRDRGTQAWILSVHGEILMNQRKFAAAVPVLEQALTLFRDDAVDPTNHALAMWTLAQALHQLGRDRDRVQTLAEDARTIFRSLGTVGAYDRDTVARFLDRAAPRFSPLGGASTK